MSYTTIYQAAHDSALEERTVAAAQKEAFNNPEYGDTEYGQLVKRGQGAVWQLFQYVMAVGTETDYEYAVNAGNPNPGGDPAVITDAAILGVVQENWPMTGSGFS